MTGTDRAMSSWLSMMRRCYISTDSSFKHYGSRGIQVCERWYDWRNFLADMGERPDGFSLDRIDVDRPYQPGNCRWADAKTQNRNTRRNVTVTVGGEQVLACDAAVMLGVSKSTISRRGRAGAPLAERRILKLSRVQVEQIKGRLSGGEGCARIAADFNVTRQHIAQIRDGRQWRGV